MVEYDFGFKKILVDLQLTFWRLKLLVYLKAVMTRKTLSWLFLGPAKMETRCYSASGSWANLNVKILERWIPSQVKKYQTMIWSVLGPTWPREKYEKKKHFVHLKGSVCWGGGSLEVWCHTDKPTETAQPGVLLSRLELLQLLGPSWEVGDLVVDGQVLQRPPIGISLSAGFLSINEFRESKFMFWRIGCPKKLQSHQNTRWVVWNCPINLATYSMQHNVSRGPVGCKFKLKISRKHIMMYDYL